MSSLNLYDTTVPQLINSLTALSGVLAKAESTAESKNLKLEDLASARLIDDMLPLTFQVQSACNTAKFLPVRVAGVANEPVEDTEKTFDELQARLAKTIAFLKAVKREDFDGKETADVEFRTWKFTGLTYVNTFAMPNFYFHVTMAYALLRQRGIEVGKYDYFGVKKPE